jgi:hypothetical protein
MSVFGAMSKMNRRVFALLFAGLFLATGSEGQDRESSTALIQLLTRADLLESMGVSTAGCSKDVEDRAAANSLARMGPSVIPDIERALTLVENRSETSAAPPHGEWLLYAYAKIDGPVAFPRLRRMMEDPALDFLSPALDNSIALSLGLTSYVSKFHLPPPSMRFIYNNRVVFCNDQEPRFGLDHFIVAWQRNDREMSKQSLGPHALASLSSLLEATTWDRLHVAFFLDERRESPAVGYRFDVAGPWSESRDVLTERRVDDSADPEIETSFTDRSGSPCGTFSVKCAGDGRAFGNGSMAYQVDNVNLADPLRVVSARAAK